MLKYLPNLRDRCCKFVCGAHQNELNLQYLQNNDATHLIGCFINILVHCICDDQYHSLCFNGSAWETNTKTRQFTSVCLQLLQRLTHKMRKASVTGTTWCRGLKTLHLCFKTVPAAPTTTSSSSLFCFLSVEIKQRNVSNLQSKQSCRNWAQCYHRWLRVRWPSHYRPLPLIQISGSTLQTMSWIFHR